MCLFEHQVVEPHPKPRSSLFAFRTAHVLLYCMSRSGTELLVVQGRELRSTDVEQIKGMVGSQAERIRLRQGTARQALRRLSLELCAQRAGSTLLRSAKLLLFPKGPARLPTPNAINFLRNRDVAW